jgi:hypothetical protein
MTASVGRDAGIVQTGHIRFSGRLAFFAWGVLHSLYVPGWRNRLSIDLNWLWSYLTHRRAALMLIGETPLAQEEPASRQPPPAAEARPGADDARHRGTHGCERGTPPAGQGLGTPRLRAAAQVPARAGGEREPPVTRRLAPPTAPVNRRARVLGPGPIEERETWIWTS